MTGADGEWEGQEFTPKYGQNVQVAKCGSRKEPECVLKGDEDSHLQGEMRETAAELRLCFVRKTSEQAGPLGDEEEEEHLANEEKRQGVPITTLLVILDSKCKLILKPQGPQGCQLASDHIAFREGQAEASERCKARGGDLLRPVCLR